MIGWKLEILDFYWGIIKVIHNLYEWYVVWTGFMADWGWGWGIQIAVQKWAICAKLDFKFVSINI